MIYFRKKSFSFLASLTILVLLVAMLMPLTVSAAQLTSRKLALGTSAGNTSTTWTFTFTTGSNAVLKGVSFQICDAASATCNTPGSWANTGATYSSLTYNSSSQAGWTLDNTTAGGAQFLGIKNNTASATSASPVVVTFNTVTNPNTTNATFYARIKTFTGNDFTTNLDSGVVAASTAAQISLTADVDESLTFCIGTSGITTTSCSGATGTTINFGTLSSSSTQSAISQIGVGTNATSGYTVSINGNTLTCGSCAGSPTITALASQTASTTGVEQFGVNLRDNVTPNVGLDPDGSGTATPTANYNTVDSYRFVNGDNIISNASADVFRRFHVAHIVNITTATEAGTYTTTLTYICVATF